MNLGRANNAFALRLLSRLRRPGQNIFFSPYSLHSALAMTANGAARATLAAMKDTLEVGRTGRRVINAAYADLRANLTSRTEVTLGIANAVWVNHEVQLESEFQAICQEAYAAQAQAVDFEDPASLPALNDWIAGQTGGHITDLVKPEDVAPPPLVILMNAIFFKGDWAKPFDAALTVSGPFSLAEGGSVDLPLMRRTVACQYAALPDVQIASLPYAGGELSFEVCLPAAESSLEALLDSLDMERWEDWQRSLHPAEVDLTLPRFRLEAEAALKQPLCEMGMAEAFAPEADFSEMSEEPAHISQVRHKAFLEVNEQGSTAAAATTVLMARTLSLHRLVMRIDRPFLCAIRHRPSGTLLFLGAVFHPQLIP
jgi:serpin B